MRDLKQGRDGATEGWRQGRHLNTCRGGEYDKRVFQCVNVCIWGGLRKCVSHRVCVCGGGICVCTVYVCACVCVCEGLYEYEWVTVNVRHSMWICLLVLSVLAWWHLSIKVPLGGLTWLQRDTAWDLRWATCSLMFHTENKAWTG